MKYRKFTRRVTTSRGKLILAVTELRMKKKSRNGTTHYGRERVKLYLMLKKNKFSIILFALCLTRSQMISLYNMRMMDYFPECKLFV